MYICTISLWWNFQLCLLNVNEGVIEAVVCWTIHCLVWSKGVRAKQWNVIYVASVLVNPAVCNHLTSFYFWYYRWFHRSDENISEEAIDYFGHKLGHKLKKLSFYVSEHESVKRFLKLTPNLESLRIYDSLLYILSEEGRLLPKIKYIKINRK